MIALVTWAGFAFGLSWVIADSKISLPFREVISRSGPLAWMLMLLECVACTGWHWGWTGYLLGIAPFHTWFEAAFFTCASNLVLAKIVGMLDEH